MKVAISVPGRFHLFNLAQQLLKRGYLSQLITSYPKFEVVKYGIPRGKTDSIIIKEIVQRGWQKIPILRTFYNPQFLIHEIFDRSAARILKPSDIFVGASSVSLRCLTVAKRLGAATIIERGSAHILYQDKILKEEYEKFGVRLEPFQRPHPKIIEKELNEYEEADYISIPSLFVRRTFLDAGIPEEKLIHIPYGVDLAEFKQTSKTDDVFRVVYAGGMSLQKGAHYLLQAFAELDLPNSELLLVGGLSDEIEPFFDKYKGHYRWIGRVPQRELASYYNQSSVFVLNSIQDGFGMVIIQAMACGLPIIATTNTGAEDIVREGQDGFIIPIRDVAGLKEKLLYLYENPEIRGAMGQSAKTRVLAGFTWDNYGDKMVKEYERILAVKNGV
ncbi:MAG: glycosyl transferase group 1 [Omnitrophica WOR_2 bacterium GWA2_47_8]|nr:MAG: glycosyl transferase group 1 [Omnitrophica WOR_2 bacterium GWA2_47_8]